MVLVRILIGKVVDRERLLGILRGVSVPGEEEGWNCVSWVREALEAIKMADKGVLGSGCVLEWERVRDKAMGFCQEKKDQHWFDGKGGVEVDNMGGRVATFDLMVGREVAI
ncbi:hypothetical protein ASPBRDRAFT_36953 [Aspergillus brasiliensis CBS 101740]|uniref:Uncharacterized protein n=1 Tax=Aspergillus brasiliensis (strain CBS 101740 / IMI 381727 / IBT 21946) TaxID=767769 RepID=A0A1L9V199_ASPBC|nr:hypothetical protein ASPBRDRAFT_36953 [Aspergillus brasiliensis CBS 101740]